MFNGDQEAYDRAKIALSLTTAGMVEVAANAPDVKKKSAPTIEDDYDEPVHGNSAKSVKLQHGYEIYEEDTGNVVGVIASAGGLAVAVGAALSVSAATATTLATAAVTVVAAANVAVGLSDITEVVTEKTNPITVTAVTTAIAATLNTLPQFIFNPLGSINITGLPMQ